MATAKVYVSDVPSEILYARRVSHRWPVKHGQRHHGAPLVEQAIKLVFKKTHWVSISILCMCDILRKWAEN